MSKTAATKQFNVYLTPDQYQLMDRESEIEGLSKSEFLRDALDRHVQHVRAERERQKELEQYRTDMIRWAARQPQRPLEDRENELLDMTDTQALTDEQQIELDVIQGELAARSTQDARIPEAA